MTYRGLVFGFLVFFCRVPVLEAGLQEAIRQQLLAGKQIYLGASTSDNARTIDASLIVEAVMRHVPVQVRQAIIRGRLNLQDVTIEQKFDLAGCVVEDHADFSHATFKRDFFVSDAVFKGGASFRDATFEHGAMLQRTRFDISVSFENVRFSEFSAEEAEFGAASFSHARFEAIADFAKSTFDSSVAFIATQFAGQGFFPGARFKGSNADFTRAHFVDWTTFGSGEPNFSSVFDGQAIFIETQFDSSTWFNGVTFQKEVTFHGARFGSTAEFRGATFHSTASFERCHFDADAFFQDSGFQGLASFRSTIFQAVYFSSAAKSATPQFRNDIDLLGCTYDQIQVNWRSFLQYPNGRSRVHAYNRQPYIQLEEVLRKSGFEDDANEVYAEQRRVENTKGWRKYQDRFYWLIANYGIDLWHELAITLILLGFGAWVFSRHGAVCHNECGFRTEPGISWWKGFFGAVHQFLPFSLPVKPQWTPSKQVVVSLGRWPIITAATYANFLQIVAKNHSETTSFPDCCR